MTKYINKNGKEYTLNDVNYYNITWKYIEIQFNEWDDLQVFNLSWWKALKFYGKDEFYYCDITWNYIEIKFNEWDEFVKFELPKEIKNQKYIFKNNKIYKNQLVEVGMEEIYKLIK